jgi:MFS family permease
MRGARIRTAAVAWVVSGVDFVYQYPLRSTSPVMMPQLSEPFGLSAFTVVSMLDPFYCRRSPFTLVAGAAVDRLGRRTVLPIAAAAGLLENAASAGLVPGASVPIILTSRANSVRPARPRECRWISTPQSNVSTWVIFGQRGTFDRAAHRVAAGIDMSTPEHWRQIVS